MRKTAMAVVLLLLATACGGSSGAAEFEMLREEVAALEADLREEVATLEADWAEFEMLRKEEPAWKDTTDGKEPAWPDGYQVIWIRICESIFADTAADNLSISPSDLCRCTLNGLMKAFLLEDYESWPQEVKDGAAAPYVTMCLLEK